MKLSKEVLVLAAMLAFLPALAVGETVYTVTVNGGTRESPVLLDSLANVTVESAAAAALVGCATSKTGLRDLKPGEKLRVGVIGCGIQMRNALFAQMLGEDSYCKGFDQYKIVACCDCDKERREAAAEQVDKAIVELACTAGLQ